MSGEVTILGAENPLIAPNNLVRNVEAMVERSIRLFQLGQPVSFVVAFAIMPDEQGQPTPRILIYFDIPSPILGAPPIGTVIVCDTSIGIDRVEPLTKGAIEQLTATRAKVLSVVKP